MTEYTSVPIVYSQQDKTQTKTEEETKSASVEEELYSQRRCKR
jgi:hypothetical protein